MVANVVIRELIEFGKNLEMNVVAEHSLAHSHINQVLTLTVP